jgi:hypothetical protein
MNFVPRLITYLHPNYKLIGLPDTEKYIIEGNIPAPEISCIVNNISDNARAQNIKVKGQGYVVPLLIKHYAMKAYGGVDV